MERDAELVTAEQFMNPKVVHLDADLPVLDALDLLQRAGYSGAPVVRDGQVVGMLSEMDLTRALAAAAFSAAPVGSVADHMTHPVTVAAPQDDLFAVAQKMTNGGLHRLPVCDGAGALVGLVALRDLGKALRTVYAERAKEPHRKPAGAAWDPQASERRDRQR